MALPSSLMPPSDQIPALPRPLWQEAEATRTVEAQRLALEVEMNRLRAEHETDKLALARERRRSQAAGEAAGSRAGRVGQLEKVVQLAEQRAARAETALASSRESNHRLTAELAALHSAARAAAEAVLPAGGSSDPIRLHNERVVDRLFRALENVWGAGRDGMMSRVNAEAMGGAGAVEKGGKGAAGTSEKGGKNAAGAGEQGVKGAGAASGRGGGLDGPEVPAQGSETLDGRGLLGLTASARAQRAQVQTLIESYREAAAEACARERGVRRRALELRARLQRYGESSADARKAVADELAALGEGGEQGGGAW
jgi:hypothetical protein